VAGLQGAIWDPEAFTVNYRDYRGERRTSAKKAAELRSRGEQAGDCVACNLCVAVCPIGIDIREGPNFARINCGLCVDACDGVMTALTRPRGLIDYDSWRNIERGHRGETRVSRLIRPKTIALGRLHRTRGRDGADVRGADEGIDLGAARPQPACHHAVGRFGPQRLHREAAQQIRPCFRSEGGGAGRDHGDRRRRDRSGGPRCGGQFGVRPRHPDDGAAAECRRPFRGDDVSRNEVLSALDRFVTQ
jgi:ferredoxin